MSMFLRMVYLSFKTSIVYKAEVGFGIIASIVQLTVWIFLWKYLFIDAGGDVGTSLQSLISYFILATALTVILIENNSVLLDTAQDVRTGRIANHLSRPYSYMISVLARSVGRTLFSLLFIVLPMIIISTALYGFTLPVSVPNFFLFLFTALTSFFIFFSIYFIAGLSSFWVMDIHGAVPLILDTTSRVFSGALIPLWLFPEWLGAIAKYLPVRFGFDLPLSIYIGKAGTGEIYQGIILEFVWLIILGGVNWLIWHLAVRRLVIQGG